MLIRHGLGHGYGHGLGHGYGYGLGHGYGYGYGVPELRAVSCAFVVT